MLRNVLIIGVVLFLSGCKSAPLAPVAEQYERFPQSAVVMGTVARATSTGLIGSESGHGSALRFDTDMMDPMNPEVQQFYAWAGGVPKPMRFSFSVPSETIVMPGRYALTRVIDALGQASNLESDRQFYSPIWFDVMPGEVVYVGEVRFAMGEKGLYVKVTDKWDEYVVTHRVPQALQARVHKRLLQLPEVIPVVTQNIQPRQ